MSRNQTIHDLEDLIAILGTVDDFLANLARIITNRAMLRQIDDLRRSLATGKRLAQRLRNQQ
jgi:hypothetical protein